MVYVKTGSTAHTGPEAGNMTQEKARDDDDGAKRIEDPFVAQAFRGGSESILCVGYTGSESECTLGFGETRAWIKNIFFLVNQIHFVKLNPNQLPCTSKPRLLYCMYRGAVV